MCTCIHYSSNRSSFQTSSLVECCGGAREREKKEGERGKNAGAASSIRGRDGGTFLFYKGAQRETFSSVQVPVVELYSISSCSHLIFASVFPPTVIGKLEALIQQAFSSTYDTYFFVWKHEHKV